MSKIARGWALTKQSGQVLLNDKQLLVFPILSSAALMLVLATFAVPLAFGVDWHTVVQNARSSGKGTGGRPQVVLESWYYAVLFAYYFANFFVITFFNSALIACALNRFDGKDSSVGSGLGIAVSRLPQILAWTAVAATVGVVLQAIQERVGWLGKIVVGLIGMAWAIATYFVVPVLVVENIGPIASIRRSVEILKRTWGESLVANLGVGIITSLAVLLAFVPLLAGVALLIAMKSIWFVVAGGIVSLVAIILISLISSTLKGILLAATYRYAATGEVPVGFDPAMLSQAFRLKGVKN